MIIKISDDSSIVEWKKNDKEDWKSAEISDLIKAYDERPRGKWIEYGYLEYKCSVCGRHISLEDHWTNITKDFPFCHCGADMRGNNNE